MGGRRAAGRAWNADRLSTRPAAAPPVRPEPALCDQANRTGVRRCEPRRLLRRRRGDRSRDRTCPPRRARRSAARVGLGDRLVADSCRHLGHRGRDDGGSRVGYRGRDHDWTGGSGPGRVVDRGQAEREARVGRAHGEISHRGLASRAGVRRPDPAERGRRVRSPGRAGRGRAGRGLAGLGRAGRGWLGGAWLGGAAVAPGARLDGGVGSAGFTVRGGAKSPRGRGSRVRVHEPWRRRPPARRRETAGVGLGEWLKHARPLGHGRLAGPATPARSATKTGLDGLGGRAGASTAEIVSKPREVEARQVDCALPRVP